MSKRFDRTNIHDAGSFQDTDIVRNAWKSTLEAAKALRSDKILFQCPASFRPTPENLKNMRLFFGGVERPGLTLLWEPRGAWSHAIVAGLCDELQLVHVVDPFKAESVTSGLTYYRLHGIGGYRYQYTHVELLALRDSIPATGDCYIMFNNSSLLEDGLRFQNLLCA